MTNGKTTPALTIAPTRRGLLRMSAGLAGSAVLMRLSSSAAWAAPSGDLQIMAWEGYDLVPELQAWRDANGVNVETTSMTSQDDVHTKFMAGNPPPFDLAEYNQAYANLYIDQLKITTPIDLATVPNFNADNIFEQFLGKAQWERDGKLTGVPWIWGFNTALYNADEISELKSYKDLLAPELKGKIAIVDDSVSMWPVTARVAGLGAKYPNLTRDELATAFAELAKYRDQARMIALNMGDVATALAAGDVVAVLCADPAIIKMTEELGGKLKMAVPEEGVVLWVDAWFVPPSADNVETALAFVNEALSPQAQADICMRLNQAPVSKEAVALMDDAARARIDYDNLAAYFAGGLPGIPPLESEEFATYDDWISAWQEFKAGI